MFERFSREARRAVTAAVEEAERRGDTSVGTEHLLLGAVAAARPGADLVGKPIDVLRDAWMEMDRAALESTGIELDMDIESAATKHRKGHVPFTGGAKQVLEDTLREAIGMGSRRLEPEHILIALTLRSPKDPAIRLLEQAGLSPDAIRTDLIQSLRRSA
ncbi:MAG: Clp protease N-terminal domain-containing protein [Acidimicrobiia bacterium]